MHGSRRCGRARTRAATTLMLGRRRSTACRSRRCSATTPARRAAASGCPVLAAIFLSNLPGGRSAARGDMRTRRRRQGAGPRARGPAWSPHLRPPRPASAIGLLDDAPVTSRSALAPGVRGRRRPGDARRSRCSRRRSRARRPRGRARRPRSASRSPTCSRRSVVAHLVEDHSAADLGEAVVQRPREDLRAPALADLDRPAELRAERERGRAGRLVLGDARIGTNERARTRPPPRPPTPSSRPSPRRRAAH